MSYGRQAHVLAADASSSSPVCCGCSSEVLLPFVAGFALAYLQVRSPTVWNASA